jgi:hypothetical protein
MLRWIFAGLVLGFLFGCGDDSTPPSDGGADGGRLDAGGADSGLVDSGATDATARTGCRSIDVLFALDSAATLAAERSMLTDESAFTTWLSELAAENGGVDVRVGVTDDDDGGFYVPSDWAGASPWFDSTELDPAALATAFTGAVEALGVTKPTAVGCAHVLTSAVDLLAADTTGFVRPDSLLVLVLVTDRDDYGSYDQIGGNTCDIGCSTVPRGVDALHASLLAAAGGDASRVVAVVVAGDPTSAGGTNLCNQPGSCCSGLDCRVFHATRLYDFAAMLGSRGDTSNLCDATAAAAIRAATDDTVAPACAAL